MNHPKLTIYDDRQGQFGPMTGLRAVFNIRTGALTSRQRIEQILGLDTEALVVPAYLADVTRDRASGGAVNPGKIADGVALLVNGRWAGLTFADEVKALDPGNAIVQGDGQVVAACLLAPHAEAFIHSGCTVLPDQVSTLRLNDRALIDRPWHILDDLPANLLADLDTIGLQAIEPSRYEYVTVFGEHAVKVHPGAEVFPGVVIDARHGPVVIDTDSVISPLAVLQGPCYIGPGSTVMPHASIRAHTVLGPCCKVGGEVSASIFQGDSNKSHAGYLGDSLVGRWVNLGAGTTTSNLKNTYGRVRAQLEEDEPAQDTGRTFFGSILGDHVRTAIGTRLPTGSVIHPGCMIACETWAPKFAAPLGFYGGDGREAYAPDKLIETIRTAMTRRDQTLSDAMRSLILSLS